MGMSTQYRGLVLLAVTAMAVTLFVAGCGGGGGTSGGGSGNGIVNAQAVATGRTITMSLETDRSDISEAWAMVTGSGKVAFSHLTGSQWGGTTTVPASAGQFITIEMYARDSQYNLLGPRTVQVTVSDVTTQRAVAGTVVNNANSAPIAGASVSLGGQMALTDSSGRFVISNLTAGLTLQGVVTKSGYSEARFTVITTEGLKDVGTIRLTATSDRPPDPPVFD